MGRMHTVRGRTCGVSLAVSLLGIHHLFAVTKSLPLVPLTLLLSFSLVIPKQRRHIELP